MTITSTPRWSLGRGNAVVPSRWQATGGHCPYCDEPVAISDLAEPTTPTTSQAVIMTT